MKMLAILLFLAGCCHHQEIRIETESPESVTVYDPNNDTLYWFDLTGQNTTKKWPHWNYHHERMGIDY